MWVDVLSNKLLVTILWTHFNTINFKFKLIIIWYSPIRVLISRNLAVFSSSQPFKQPIRFLQRHNFARVKLDPKTLFIDGIKNPQIGVLKENGSNIKKYIQFHSKSLHV